MSQSFSLTGQDTIQMAGRVLQNFGDGDVFKGTYDNELVTVKRGKDGNAIYALNSMGVIVSAQVRVLRGSADDKFLNGLRISMLADLPSFALIPAYMVKRIGDGAGNVIRDTYYLSGGVFTKIPGVDSNVEGNTEQAISVYDFKFANTDRAIA